MRLSIFHSTSRALREFFLVLVQGYERAPRVSQLPNVSNVYEDADLIQNLDKVLEKYNIEYVIWAQDVAEIGNRSYMRALNPLLKEGGVSDVGTDS